MSLRTRHVQFRVPFRAYLGGRFVERGDEP